MDSSLVEKIAALTFGACWSCSEREGCNEVGCSLTCAFRNARKSQGALDLRGGDFANSEGCAKDVS